MKPLSITLTGLTCLLVALALCTSSNGQITPDLPPKVPQPISTAELDGYAALLRLSEAQHLGVEIEFERYLDDFQPLREEMADIILQPGEPRRRGGYDMPSNASLTVLVNRVRNHDEALFVRIEELLTDEQRQRMHHVRMRRERVIYSNLRLMHRLLGDNLTDLSRLIELLDLPADVAEQIDRRLPGYEDRLTRGLRDVFHSTIRVCHADVPREADVNRVINRVSELREMNLREYRELSALMPPAAQRQFEREFLRRAYSTAFRGAQYISLARIENALTLPDLTDNQHAVLTAMRDEVLRHRRKMLAERIAATDKNLIDVIDRTAPREPSEFLNRINELNAEIRRFDHEQSRTIFDLLGDKADEVRSATIERVHSRGSRHHVCHFVVRVNQYSPSPPADFEPIPAWKADGLIHSAIDAEDLTQYLATLRPDDDEAQAVRELHSEYARSVEDLFESHQHELQQVYGARIMHRRGDEQLAVIDESITLRSTINAAVQRADEHFFDQLRDVLDLRSDDPRLLTILRLRERQRLNLPNRRTRGTNPNQAAELDLVRLLILTAPQTLEEQSIAELITSYEIQLERALAARHEAFIAQVDAEMLRRAGARAIGKEDLQQQREWMLNVQRRHRAIAAINQDAAEQFAAALPPEDATAVMDRFHRAAYQSVFVDASSMKPAIERASRLPDATAAQRDDVSELRAEYLIELERIRREMIDLCAGQHAVLIGVGRTIPPEELHAAEAFLMLMTGLEDRREGLNRRARRELRTILSREQIARINIPELR